MTRKSILFVQVGKAELVDIPLPELKTNEVLVRTAISTISSGTERANLCGDLNVSPMQPTLTVAKFPRSSGYSTSGTVEAVGAAVTKVAVGDRVAMCWSCHTDLNVLSENLVYKLDDNISFETAALLHIGTFPMAAIRKTRLEFGEPAIVMGQGILGQIAVLQLKVAGASPVIAVDLVKERRDIALNLGADFALDPTDSEFVNNVKAICPLGVPVAIEVTGVGKGFDQVLDCMAQFGRVALLGCTRNSDFTIDYYRKIHRPGITVVGAHTMARPEANSYPGYWTRTDDMEAQLRLIKYGRLSYNGLVKDTRSPVEAPEVFNRLANDPHFPITQFDWRRLL
ncbi:MAG TPA: zinc-binding alcohol dehydrogenase [Clostridia bacterium]|nr:zinc-binding alcohol dehydrogenase [Clostridia bacterium]